ncbi:uncharacterized protein LOC113066665 isoform X5 [Carassius auratus]|uniref:Uncharacterized protein LOC113066665 isoform X5 n=1 Tax=Carassius auratus TaxID=7957 RepID=A0A6P6MEQ0_CARAU|nr:uncharacterized protein LOC113066665 isoform X5 [Carassius auratus]
MLGNVVLILVFRSCRPRRERCRPYTTNYYSRRLCKTVRRRGPCSVCLKRMQAHSLTTQTSCSSTEISTLKEIFGIARDEREAAMVKYSRLPKKRENEK